MFASPASAAITELGRGFESGIFNFMYFGSTNLGGGMVGGTEGGTYKCNDTNGEYYSKPAGMTCNHEKVSGTWCYKDCACDADRFPYSASGRNSCSGLYFTAPTASSDICTDSTGTYYASCACANGLIEQNDFNSKYSGARNHFSISSPAYANDRRGIPNYVACYTIDDAECSKKVIPSSDIKAVTGGSDGEFSVLVESEPIWYKVASFAETAAELKSGSVYVACSYEVDKLEEGAYSKAPTGTQCASYTNTQAKYSYAPYTYYYYTGNCMDSGVCSTSSSECAIYASETFITFNPDTGNTGNGSCKRITGCKSGWNDEGGYFCTWAESGEAESVVPQGVSYTSIHSEDGYYPDCIKVTGCSTDYTPVAFKESSYGSEASKILNDYTLTGMPAENISVYSSTPDDNNEYGLVACVKSTKCEAGKFFNAQTGTCSDYKGGDFQYLVLETSNVGQCTIMETKVNIINKTSNAIAREAAREYCNTNLAFANATFANARDYRAYIMSSHDFPSGYNKDGKYRPLIGGGDVFIETIDGKAILSGPSNSVFNLYNGYTFTDYAASCKGNTSCDADTSTSIVENNTPVPGEWYCPSSQSFDDDDDGTGCWYILESHIGDYAMESPYFYAIPATGDTTYVGEPFDQSVPNIADETCEDMGEELISYNELKYLLENKDNLLTQCPLRSVFDSGYFIYSGNCYNATTYGACADDGPDYSFTCKRMFTLGYPQPINKEYCALRGLDFDTSDTSCEPCDSSKIFDNESKECVDGATYCGALNKIFNSDTKTCVLCPSDKVYKDGSCMEKCASQGGTTSNVAGKICERFEVEGKKCYKNCVTSLRCGGAVYDTGTYTLKNPTTGATVGVKQDDKYYTVGAVSCGGRTYSEVTNLISATTNVAPASYNKDAVVELTNLAGSFWLADTCGSNAHLYRDGDGQACTSDTSAVTCAVILNSCNADASCTGYDKSVSSTFASYSCDCGYTAYKCNSNRLKYKCVSNYGSANVKAALQYSFSNLSQYSSQYYVDVLIIIKNKCGKTVATISGDITSSSGTIYSDVAIPTSGEYSVDVSIGVSSKGGAGNKYITFGTLEVDGTNYASSGISGSVPASLSTSETLLVRVSGTLY